MTRLDRWPWPNLSRGENHENLFESVGAVLWHFRDLLKEQRTTALYVTHDLREAAALGDRIAVMERGHIVQEGTLDSLRARPASSFVRELLDDLVWAGTAGA